MILVPALSTAQMNLGVQIGTAVPVGPDHFSKYWSPGYNLGGGLGFPINDAFEIVVNAGLTGFIFNHTEWEDDYVVWRQKQLDEEGEGEKATRPIVSGGNRIILDAGVLTKYKVQLNGMVKPYAVVGGGVINMATDDLLLFGSGPDFIIETVPYYEVGIGSEFEMSKDFALFLNATYKHAFTDDKNDAEFAVEPGATYSKNNTTMLGITFGVLFNLN